MSHNARTRPLEVSKGGTGATTAAAARTALGASSRIVVWEDAEVWADVLFRLVEMDFSGTLLVVNNTDYSPKVITAGSYDFGSLKVVGVGGANPSTTASINLDEGVIFTGTTLDLASINMVSTATATPHISTTPASGFVLRLKDSDIYASATTSFALFDQGTILVYLDNSQLGVFGSTALFDVTNGSNPNYYLFNGSYLTYPIQDNASAGATVYVEAGSYYYPSIIPNDLVTESFPGVSVGGGLIEWAVGVKFKDSVSPTFGSTNVQGALDAIKATYARLFEVPLKVSFEDLTGQTAAIAATTIYPVPAAGAGMYRISWVAKVTTPASVSSVLGGTALGLQVVYTDADDSVVATTQAALSGSTNAGNTTVSTAGGVIIVSAAASTDIQYKIGYTSAGTAMAYNLHIKVEAL